MKTAHALVASLLFVACDSGAALPAAAPEVEPRVHEREPAEAVPSEAEPGAPAEPAATEAPVALATLENAGADRCVLGRPIEVGRAEGRAVDVSLAFRSSDRGLVVWSIDASHVRARSIGPGMELGDAVESELGRARKMEILAPVGDRYLLIAPADMCNQDGSACVYARVLSAEGSAVGPQLDQPLSRDQQVEMRGWVSLPEGGVTSLATRWGGAAGVRYRVAADGAVSAETIVDCCGGAGPSEGPYPALLPDGNGVLAIGLHEGTLGDAEPAYRLARWPAATSHPLTAIPYETARVLAAAIDGEEVHVLYRPEEGPVYLLRIDAEGRRRGRPRVVRRGEPLPSAFGDRVIPRLEVAGGRLLLHRVDAAEREIGEPTEIARGNVSPDAATVAFSGRDLVVAHGVRDRQSWTVFLRAAACAR